ncbi:hypothetical protein PV569_12945 [Streptomyces scabiei]|uniref:hypothetical protein n=1 Tax=Streptomyces scabiei TaxID=1930 RepID=UPI0029A6D40F|nr:hypothetical protein [Streptomyces scabiei]MDX3294613.1 hypothetical protein [Streptomyces scabiei]
MTLFTHRNAGGRCPCGAMDATCGPSSDVVPVDQRIEEVTAVSGPLKKYWFTRGDGVKTVLKLNDADAARQGLGPDDLFQKDSLAGPATDGGDGDGAADDSGDVQAVAAADAGSGAEPVQPAADSGSDSQAPGDPAAAPDPGDEKEAAVTEADETVAAAEPADPDDSGTAVKASAKAPAKKTAAKRATSANKARTASANKAESPGG